MFNLLLLLFFFIFIAFFYYYYLSFSFKNTKIVGQKYKDFIVLYSKKLNDDDDPAYILWNEKTKSIYYNWDFLFLYNIAVDYYHTFFGFGRLQGHIYYLSEFNKFGIYQKKCWSRVFTYSIYVIDTVLKDFSILLSYFYSFMVFLFFSIVFKTYPALLSKVDLDYIYFFRYFLVLLVFIYIIYIIYFLLFKNTNQNEYISEYVYIKLLVLFWKMGQDLQKFLHNYFCILINLVFLFSFFWKIGQLALFSKAFCLYVLVLWFFICLNFFCKFLVKRKFENKFVLFFSNNKFTTFLLFPTGSIALFVFYYCIWWLLFIIGSLKGKPFYFLFYFLVDKFRAYFNVPFLYNIMTLYNDTDINRHLNEYYWYDYISSYRYLCHKEEYEEYMKTKIDDTKDIKIII